jgi:enoyl-[acyl-carrier-protein] reductase (NADH)
LFAKQSIPIRLSLLVAGVVLPLTIFAAVLVYYNYEANRRTAYDRILQIARGVAPAMSAVEALTRDLSAELAPQGIRVVGLRPQGMPDSGTIKEVFGLHGKAWGISHEQFHELIASRTHVRRLTTLEEMANVAAFMASDEASALTGTIVNLSLGSLDD